MKACPTCHRKYYDETMKFCLDDGALLTEQRDSAPAASPADATLHLPSFDNQPPTVRITEPSGGPRSTMASMGTPALPAVSAQRYPGEVRRRGAFLWVLGALIIGIAAVAVALIVTRNRVPGGDSSNQIASASPAQKTTEPGVAVTPATATTTTGNAAATPQAQNRSAIPSPSSEKKAPTVQPETRQTSKDSPAPPPPETPARRGPISGGVLNGKAVNLVKPSYPPIARAANASGAVNVQVTIDEQGNVISARAISGHPLLQASAVSAAKASKFRPTMLSGQPVKVTGVITYNFVVQ